VIKVQHIYRQNTKANPLNNEQANHEGQECKTGHVKGRALVGRRRERKRGKEGDYGWCIFYTCVNMEQ
jgi:hypothetical protein